MALNILTRERRSPGPAAEATDPAERYNAYFPRLFAYVRSCLGDDGDRAREIIVDSCFHTLDRYPSAPEQEFRFALFRTARRLCQSALKRGSARDDHLTPREREILVLTFDAQLTRSEISRLCRLRESAVTAHLMTALRKLRQQASPAITAAYLKLTHPQDL